MSETKKYDSVIMGYAEEPMVGMDGKIQSWKIRLKEHEVAEILKNYVTAKQEDGKGGNVFLTLRISKGGKPYCTVYDPHSAGAKEQKTNKAKANAEEDLPF
jgi:hypothetical protein